jgi:hypothetical protein
MKFRDLSPSLILVGALCLNAQLPHATQSGFALPNGWSITPVGRSVRTEDMDFSQWDIAPMGQLNQVLWKAMKGADSVMPALVHHFGPLIGVE